MNEDEMQALEPQAGETLERMLARYARVRLDPSPAETRRARAAVMEEAWRRRFELPAGAAANLSGSRAASAAIAPVSRSRRWPFAGWGTRRLSGALSAAAIAGLLLGTTAFATSRAGGPLYETRLAVEELTLPSDPASHVEAEIAMAQARIAEIVEASSRDDAAALAAALLAYERTAETLGATTGPPAQRALEAVASHQAVLERVASMVPVQAQGGIDHARAAGGRVIDRLSAAGGGLPGASSPGGGPNGNGGGAGGKGIGGGNGPGVSASAEPGPKDKPGRTPRPRPTKVPADQGDKRGATPSPGSGNP
ncbi:MAG: hypothetical protein MUQ32_15120 [Chloroflexi bacterium]|nr:hypothetical protein [Chloroflexota bacterium]